MICYDMVDRLLLLVSQEAVIGRLEAMPAVSIGPPVQCLRCVL
jgi:hypothetical protein